MQEGRNGSEHQLVSGIMQSEVYGKLCMLFVA